eukprot:scaffold7829_cov71-Skeletonema_dohrnii-CCMP3373.AAC.1
MFTYYLLASSAPLTTNVKNDTMRTLTNPAELLLQRPTFADMLLLRLFASFSSHLRRPGEREEPRQSRLY